MKLTHLVTIIFTGSLWFISAAGHAFDSAKDSTVDKADRFEFEDFHKDSAVTLWGKDKKDNKEDKQAITTYEEPKNNTASPASAKEGMLTTEVVKSQAKTSSSTAKTFDKDQELKVRSAYKLSADPSLAAVPTLFEAIQNLHQQLNAYCPNGWKKEDEWHLPETNYFYIHYRARCL